MAVLATGCASTDAGDGQSDAVGKPIAVGKVPVVTSAEQLTFPLDAYQLSLRESRQIEEALDSLVVDCMTKQGFNWAAPQRPPLRDGGRNGRRYGLLDPEEGSRTGYHGTVSTGKGAKGNESGQDDSPAAQQAAGQCVLSQRAKLNGQQKADKANTGPDEQIEQLILQDAARAEKDPQVRAVWAKWSDCMEEAGYSYATPWDANNDPKWGKSPAATDDERSVATADAKCKIKHNVAGVWMAVEIAYQKRTLEAKAESLEAAKKTNETRLRNAAEVIGRG
ncbi:hypothetical protein [Streptomyces sp. TRM49041]|uniref:hypothetical protein n=1 Tax=Streptomyces sp. TRM49041 TaxID=2603216 RepID=UPI0011EC2770|nr:hypothetical protein [Streptomyces sp. TRM49041]